MLRFTKKEIAEYQCLYLINYGKAISFKEAEIKLDALIGLLRLFRDCKIPSHEKQHTINVKLTIEENS